MAFNIFEKKHEYIGLHLNAHALKAVQFERVGGSVKLRAYTSVPLMKGMITADTFTDHTLLANFIGKNMQKPQFGSFTTNRVIISIPESKSFVRVISMQRMNESQAENAIMFEAEAYIPLPMDQVYFDWRIISQKENTMDVLLTASPKEYVDAYMNIVEKAGFKICGVELEAQSIARALVPKDMTQPALIAGMDALKTDLIMVKDGIVQFTSSVPIAGNVFTERLAKALSVPPAKAEEIKRTYGLTNTVEYPNLKTQLMPCVEDLASEIKNILKFHYDHAGSHVNQLLITGGGAKLQHLAEVLEPMLEDQAPLKIVIADPLQYVPRLMKSPLEPYEALSFTTAIGLALWEVIV